MIEQTETTANDDTTPEAPLGPIAPRNRTLLLFAAILAVAVLGYLFLSSQTAAQRPLKPPRNTATPNVIAISSQPVIVTFAQLNEDPFALINRTIRVTGSYTPLDLPRCDGSYSGPHIVWALIAEELQLDARGFEQIMALVPPGTNLTIEGIWRHYEGPHGCGKEPPTATVWYLEVSRIVQPNPLPLLNGTAVSLDTIATPTFAPTTDPAAQPTVLVGTPLPTAAGEETDPATTPIPIDILAPANNIAAQNAAQALAQTLGVDKTAVSFDSLEAQSWPDSCLGIEAPGMMCAQHVVDGYLVTMRVAGQQYAYRTNADGSELAAEVAVTWTREGGIAGFCNELIIDVTGMMTAYSCEGMPYTEVAQQLLNPEPRQQLYDWLNTRQPFDYEQSDSAVADAMSITLSFNGHGDAAASDTEQSNIEAFAAQFYSQMAMVEVTPTPAVTEEAACTVVANSDVTLYNRPDTASGEFGTLAAGETAVVMGQTANGWLGFDPGVAQAANVGIFRLRWVAPDSDVTQSGGCAALTEYPSISPTACYEMAMADTPVYEQPDDTAVTIATLPAGEYTAITGKTDQDWYQVDLSDGTLADSHGGEIGWITSAAVNFNGQSCSSLPTVMP